MFFHFAFTSKMSYCFSNMTLTPGSRDTFGVSMVQQRAHSELDDSSTDTHKQFKDTDRFEITLWNQGLKICKYIFKQDDIFIMSENKILNYCNTVVLLLIIIGMRN